MSKRDTQKILHLLEDLKVSNVRGTMKITSLIRKIILKK
jgi:hypothetical protein